MSINETLTPERHAMQTILVSDENYVQWKHLADKAGQTIEGMLESIVKTKTTNQERLRQAALALQEDYANDEELTAFTALDGEDFYEYDDETR